MRAVFALMILVAAAPARAGLDVCAAEREDAAARPPAAEDVRAYEACRERWRELLPRADAELTKPPPRHIDACDGPFARWQDAAAVAPDNYDAMVRRLAARDETERCIADAQAPREPLAVVAARIAAEHQREQRDEERRDARSWVVAGPILLSVGGTGLTALGGAGIHFIADGTFDKGEGVVLPFIFGFVGAACAASTIAGVLLLRFGARRLHRD